MKAILRSINNFSCKLKQNNNLKYDISPKIRSNKFKSISGNGNVVIEDAIKRNLKDYKIYGNTCQNSTIGKNLFDKDNANVYGGYLSASGIVSGSGNSSTDTIVYIECKPNTTYALQKMLQPDTENNRFRIGCTSEIPTLNMKTTNFIKYNDGTTNTEYVYTTSSTANYLLFYCGKKSDITSRQEILDSIQIEEGSTVTSYEPYTGGQPSPNPDYPQEIISRGDRTKNLLNYTKWTNAYIGTNGVIYTDNSYKNALFEDYIEVKPNTKYTMSTKTTVNNIGVSEFDSSKTFIKRNQFAYDVSQGTIITTNDTRFIRISINYNGSSAITDSIINNLEPMFELSEIRTSYEPYGYKIPINVKSDNLFDKEHYNYIAAYLSNSNIITAGGEGTRCLYVKCSPNTTYNVSKTSLFGNDRFCLFDTSSFPTIGDTALSYVGTRAGNNNSKDLTITTNPAAQYLCIFVKASTTAPSASIQEIANTLQIVEGSTAPSKYIPYHNETTNIYLDAPLRKIGEYSDYIDFINGKVVRNITEFILDGARTTNLYFNSASQNTSRIQYTSNPRGGSNDTNIFCNQLLGKLNYNADVEGLYVNGVSVVLRINKDKIGTSITTANEYFSVNPLILNYILETPTEKDIELPNINLIEGKNIITIDTEVQGIFDVQYYSKEIIDISNYKYNLRKVED